MAIGHEEHAHEHRFMDIVDAENISAFEQAPHGIITLQFHQRGFAVDLTYDEALTLGAAMASVVDYLKAKGQ